MTDRPERPGGFAITDRALEFCAFSAGSALLDVGCGSGATVQRLRQKGLEAYGLDRDDGRVRGRPHLVCGRGESNPFRSASADGVVMECSLSLMDDQDAALRECHRALKPDGRLVVSDLYAQQALRLFRGCLGRIDTREGLLSLLRRNGFITELFEDHSEHLVAYWGQMLFDMGSESFEANVGVDICALRAARCGYSLVVARRGNP